MSNKLSCQQIESLLEFYADGTLNVLLQSHVREHIENCKQCRDKLNKLTDIINSPFKNQTVQPETNQYITKQYEDFKKNLSAYIDNELDDSENIKIKKFSILNPLARKDLENILKFKKLMHNSFEKTKNDIKYDFSKSITTKVQQELQLNNNEPFYKIAVIFFIMLSAIVISFITLLNF